MSEQKLKPYLVTVREISYSTYRVHAESKDDAMENYLDGDYIDNSWTTLEADPIRATLDRWADNSDAEGGAL